MDAKKMNRSSKAVPLLAQVAELAASIEYIGGQLSLSEAAFSAQKSRIVTLSSESAQAFATHCLALAAKTARIGKMASAPAVSKLLALAHKAIEVSAKKPRKR